MPVYQFHGEIQASRGDSIWTGCVQLYWGFFLFFAPFAVQKEDLTAKYAKGCAKGAKEFLSYEKFPKNSQKVFTYPLLPSYPLTPQKAKTLTISKRSRIMGKIVFD